MSIEIERTGMDADDWDDIVERSPQTSPFHRYETLQLLASHTDRTLHPLVGYKGQEPVGILPVFEGAVGPIRLAVSPPSGFEVFSLGPALTDPGNLKQRKRERRNRRFVEGCLDWVEREIDPHITHLRTVDQYTDLRPFQDAGFDVTPYYTYVVDLTPSEEELLMSFSSDARSNVRSAEEFDYAIEVGDADDCAAIIGHVADRLDEIGKPYPLTPEAGAELYRRLPEGTVQPYVCTLDGDRLGGIVTIEHEDTVYRWQGGAKRAGDFPVNDVLDWHVMQAAKERGCERYNLVGANLSRTAKYKAKFGPEPVPYYGAKRQVTGMGTLQTVRSAIASLG